MDKFLASKMPGMPEPEVKAVAEQPTPVEESFLERLKGIYAMQFSKRGSPPQVWNFHCKGNFAGDLKSAIVYARKFCSTMGYTYIWVRPFIQDFDLIMEKATDNAPGQEKSYPLPPASSFNS